MYDETDISENEVECKVCGEITTSDGACWECGCNPLTGEREDEEGTDPEDEAYEGGYL